ncbi:hypothetical protein EVAR_18973_1 [Eumeta japonica]|uniref:Uncharacterized protein n=1 Tax=Eumeta variegata TaxID=151549 RepID=A0A4C1WYD0_EUMVA|nr:hypothetical protein EVAR_18973_1 [Eumeta japonica]
MSSVRAEPRGACCAQFSDRTCRFEPKIALYKGYIRSRITYAAPACYALCSVAQKKRIQAQQNIALRMIVGTGRPRPPMNSSGTSHRCTRGRRVADLSPETSSKRLLPERKEQTPVRAGLHKLDFRKVTIITRIRRGHIPDEKTPGQ